MVWGLGCLKSPNSQRRKPQGYDLVCSLYDQIAAGRRRISWQVSGQCWSNVLMVQIQIPFCCCVFWLSFPWLLSLSLLLFLSLLLLLLLQDSLLLPQVAGCQSFSFVLLMGVHQNYVTKANTFWDILQLKPPSCLKDFRNFLTTRFADVLDSWWETFGERPNVLEFFANAQAPKWPC